MLRGTCLLYLQDRRPTARYTSYDYCFNYFRSFLETGQVGEIASSSNLQLSCLQLGFYLASWGMLRGSSPLLSKSVKHYVPVMEAIASADSAIWTIDADGYTEAAIKTVMEVRSQLRSAFPQASSHILITKIMLGVFGCVPAFDGQFKKGFGVWGFGPKELRLIGQFYSANADVIEGHRVATIDFVSGEPTQRKYTRAKVIDMIFFIEGRPRAEVRE